MKQLARCGLVSEVIFVSFICRCLFFHDDDDRVSFLSFFNCPCFLLGLTLWFAFSDRSVKGLDVGFVILFQMCYFLH